MCIYIYIAYRVTISAIGRFFFSFDSIKKSQPVLKKPKANQKLAHRVALSGI